MNTLREYETKIFNKINPAVKFSVSRYVLAVGFFVAIVVFGLITTMNLGVDQLPSMSVPVVVVSTTFTGATPAVVDQQITQVIESAISTISGISEISSTSQTGSSTVIIDFESSTDKYVDANQVSSAVSASAASLPSGAATPIVKTLDPNSSAIIQVGISGSGANLADVYDYVENNLIPNLQRVNGVADISTDGGPTKEFQVLLNPSKLSSHHLDASVGCLCHRELRAQYVHWLDHPPEQRLELLHAKPTDQHERPSIRSSWTPRAASPWPMWPAYGKPLPLRATPGSTATPWS